MPRVIANGPAARGCAVHRGSDQLLAVPLAGDEAPSARLRQPQCPEHFCIARPGPSISGASPGSRGGRFRRPGVSAMARRISASA